MTTQDIRQAALRRASAAAAAARRPSGCNHCSGQKSGKPANPGIPPTFADSSQSRRSCTRERRTTLASHRAIFAIHRCRRAAAAPTTHTREACRGTCSPSRCQHRGFVGSSRREEALIQLSRHSSPAIGGIRHGLGRRRYEHSLANRSTTIATMHLSRPRRQRTLSPLPPLRFDSSPQRIGHLALVHHRPTSSGDVSALFATRTSNGDVSALFAPRAVPHSNAFCARSTSTAFQTPRAAPPVISQNDGASQQQQHRLQMCVARSTQHRIASRLLTLQS
jgi:hypothetical protein